MKVSLFILSCFVCFSCNHVIALYEDQIGKFDWKKEFVGKVENAVFESSLSASKNVFVSTSKNVIACLSTRTGLIVWRKNLGEVDGKILHLVHTKNGLLTATEQGMVRIWDSNSGTLKWEVDFSSNTELDGSEEFLIIDLAILERSYTEGNLLIVLSTVGLHSTTILASRKKAAIETLSINLASTEKSDNKLFVDSANEKIICLQLQSGSRLLSSTYSANDMEELFSTRVDISWIDNLDATAILEDGTLFYVSKEAQTLNLVDLESGTTKLYSSFNGLDISSDISSIVADQNRDIRQHGFEVMLVHADSQATLLKVKDQNFKVVTTQSFPGLLSVECIHLSQEAYSFIAFSQDSNMNVAALNLKSGEIDESLSIKYKLPANSGRILKVFINMFLKRSTPVGFRSLVTSEDRSVALVSHPSKVTWRREEALASVVNAAMLDLPLSDVDAGIEAEFEKSENFGIFDMFAKRVKAQGGLVSSWSKQLLKEINEDTLFRHKTRDPLIQVEGMTRDPFSLHKMIVLVTEPGALFGVDSLSGDIMWRFYSKKLEGRKLHFHVQRTTAHFSLPPRAVVLAVDPLHETPPVVITINPFTGHVIEQTDRPGFDSSLIQVMLSPFTDANHVRAVIALDAEMRLHFFPDTEQVRSQVEKSKLFFYDVSPEQGVIRGFTVVDSSSAELVWSVAIVKSHRIIGFAAKQPFEKVDSMGRPLADRSVIYKYLNPNLIAVLSESTDDNIDRSSLLLHVIDAVTGQVIHTALHKKARGPVQVVHSENWLVYSYWNTKARRTELSSFEFYEGKTQHNSTAFSSFHRRPLPLVVQQAYIFPVGIASIGVTKTEKALTSRQLLFGLKSGTLFGLPRRYFDPRRPLTMTESHKEEGLMPYMPEVPLPPELFLSYNQTLEDISTIYSAPAALESTSLILVTGLDIFFTRSQPSKMFDVLKEDFDYLLISGVVVLMLAAAFITRRMSQIKQLNKSWR